MIQAPDAATFGTFHTGEPHIPPKMAVVCSWNVDEGTSEKRANLMVYPDFKHTRQVSYEDYIRVGGEHGKRFVPFAQTAGPARKDAKHDDGSEGGSEGGAGGETGRAGRKGRGGVRGGNG